MKILKFEFKIIKTVTNFKYKKAVTILKSIKTLQIFKIQTSKIR